MERLGEKFRSLGFAVYGTGRKVYVCMSMWIVKVIGWASWALIVAITIYVTVDMMSEDWECMYVSYTLIGFKRVRNIFHAVALTLSPCVPSASLLTLALPAPRARLPGAR